MSVNGISLRYAPILERLVFKNHLLHSLKIYFSTYFTRLKLQHFTLRKLLLTGTRVHNTYNVYMVPTFDRGPSENSHSFLIYTEIWIYIAKHNDYYLVSSRDTQYNNYILYFYTENIVILLISNIRSTSI